MNKLFFFTSSEEHDAVNHLVVMSSNTRTAFALIKKYFTKKGFKGNPVRLAI